MIPIVADPNEGESLDSWLEYLADLNHCRPRDISGRIDKNPSQSACLSNVADGPVLTLLSATTGIPTSTLERCTTQVYEQFGLRTSVRAYQGSGTWFMRNDSGYCPTCLREDDLRWQLSWHVRWTSVCTRHLTVICDACPHCGGRIRATTIAHPRRTSSPRSNWRAKQCPYGCSTETLAQADVTVVDEGSEAVRGQQWINKVIKDGEATCAYTQGRRVSAQTVFADLAVLTRHALYALTPKGKLAGTESDETEATRSNSRLLRFVTSADFLEARVMAMEVLHEPDSHHSWLTRDRVNRIIQRDGRGQRLRISAPLRRTLGLHSHLPTYVSTQPERDAIGRLRTQHATIGVEYLVESAIDQMNLSASLWPTVRVQAPKLPPRIERSFAITGPILLAGLGRHPHWSRLAREFGLDADEPTLRRTMAQLITNECGSDALDYLLELHAHLGAYPPPIDYRRRRRLFPNPTGISGNRARSLARSADAYLTHAFRWKIDRYIWQLLTGNDPFVTNGVALLHGPAAYAYRKFVHTMQDPLRAHAGEVAQRLLLRHRIGEPVTYQPRWDHQQRCWSPEGHCDHYLPDTGRNDLRRSSLSLAAAVSTAGDAEELVHLALAGEPILARRLTRFIDTAHLPDLKSAGDVLGVQPLQVTKERSYLADGLGDDLYTATLPKMLSSAGSELLDLARPHRDRLREIGRDAPGRRDPADGPNSAVDEAQYQRKTRRRYRPTANGIPEQHCPIPDSLPDNEITALMRQYPMLSTAGVRRLLRPRDPAPKSLADQGTVINFQFGHALYYPAFQFDTRTRYVRPVVGEINEHFGTSTGPLAVARWWFATQVTETDGRSPAELAIEGSHDDALRRACRMHDDC
ncbi:TniQ family protein [Rhodococcus tukisamuensis]|uniref:TniQ protein n=1 Tax=Rhodococcus tukisamuensis TaxID=168276 RepID=A0A1G7DGA2_9NOCA|nr:TniQ family protein [Rhodococcus tukisamuensis]SDE50547.1 TniQ protein [Rhodococcus tukisamuensis]